MLNRKSTTYLLLLIFLSLFLLGTLEAQDKKVVFSGHALARMKERNITRPQVEETVRHADRRIFRQDERIQALKEFPQGVLKVIYVEEQTRYLIITTYWDKKRENQL